MKGLKSFITSLVISFSLIAPTLALADYQTLSVVGNPLTSATAPYLLLNNMTGQSACSVTVASFGGSISVEGLYRNTTNSQWTAPLTVYSPDGTTTVGTTITAPGSYIFNCGTMTSVRADGTSTTGTPTVVLNATGGVNVIAKIPGANGGTVTSVSGTGNISSTGGTAPVISITSAPTFSGNVTVGNLTDTPLTPGNCVQAGTGGLLTTIAGACGTGNGTVTSVTATGPVTSSGGTAPNIACATCVTGVSGTGNISSTGGTTPVVSITSAPTFLNVTDSALTSGRCVQAGTAGILSTIGVACGTGNGTVTSVTASGNLASSGGTTPNITVTNAPTFTGALSALSLTGTGLTSGNCLQAGVGGLIGNTAFACGSGNGTVTSVTASGNLASSGGNTPNVTVTDSPTFAGTVTATTNIVDSALTIGRCVQTGTAGVFTNTAFACGSGNGTVASVSGGTNITTSGTAVNPIINTVASPTFSGTVTATTNIIDSALTSGNCLQAGASGLIQNIAVACGTVTSVTAGSNIVIGGTSAAPTVAITASPTLTNMTLTALATAGVNCAQVGSTGLFQLPGGTNIGGCPINATNATFVIPAQGGSVSVSTLNFSAFPKNGLPVTIDDGTHAMYGLITAGANTATWTVTNLGLTLGSVGNTMASGALIYPGASSIPTNPTQTSFLSGSGTYTTPAGVKWVRIFAVGGGGGGGGSNATGGTGGTGGNTTFGTSLIVANGGTGGIEGSAAAGGTGGTASLGTAVGLAVTGGGGSPYYLGGGGTGGSSCLGGAGSASGSNSSSVAGSPGATNTGGGGGGANGSTAGSTGGGSGGCVQAVITAPLATYAYAVGAAGTAGTAGTSGFAGGAGGSGILTIEEHYNY